VGVCVGVTVGMIDGVTVGEYVGALVGDTVGSVVLVVLVVFDAFCRIMDERYSADTDAEERDGSGSLGALVSPAKAE